ncbi:hypothetical protein [Sphingobium sp.]|jgi:hypothetical protein
MADDPPYAWGGEEGRERRAEHEVREAVYRVKRDLGERGPA